MANWRVTKLRRGLLTMSVAWTQASDAANIASSVTVGLDDLLEVYGLVVIGVELGDQLAAAGHADLGEDRLEVVADGVGRQEQLGGDLGGAGAAGDQAGGRGASADRQAPGAGRPPPGDLLAGSPTQPHLRVAGAAGPAGPSTDPTRTGEAGS
jgi:hypothetical protein